MPAPSPEPSKPVDTQPPGGGEEAEDLCMYGLDTARLRQRGNNPFSIAQLQDSSSFSSFQANDFFDANAGRHSLSSDPPPFSTTTGLYIPFSTSLTSFYNLGDLSYGTFSINVTSAEDIPQPGPGGGIWKAGDGKNKEKGPIVYVQITVSYHTREAIEKSKICYFRDGNRLGGINIVVRHSPLLNPYCARLKATYAHRRGMQRTL